MIQARLPSGRVVQIDTDDPKVAAATARAYVAKSAYESAHARGGGLAGGLETAVRAVPGLSELQAVVPTAVNFASDAMAGKPDLAAAWKKARDTQSGWADGFQRAHPIAADLTKGATMAAPVAAAIMTGGASAAPEAAEAAPVVAKGVAGFLQRNAAPAALRAARRGTVGAMTGAAVGAGQPGDLSQRLQGADDGAVAGGAIGVAAPPVLSALGAGAANAGGTIARTVTRAANKATGGAILDANQVAAQRIVEALKSDGATPQAIRDAMNGFLKNGATDPSLIDVASRLPSGGQNTLALVRAAATKGSGRGVAVQYSGQVAADLQDKAIARTKALTSDQRPANVVRDAAAQSRADTAEKEYAAPYGTTVDAAPIISALDGDAGRRALAGAQQGADARRLPEQIAEIAKLRQAAGPEEIPTASIGGDAIPASPALAARIKAAVGGPDDTIPVSLGTLHRTKVALEEAGRAAAKADANSVAGGLFNRAEEIDNHLASNSPEYAQARDHYATASAGLDALDHGATGISAAPDEYAAGLGDLTERGGEPAKDMAGIGYRQSLTDALGAPTENAKGVLNRVSTSTNQGRNLATTFGDEAADNYRGGLKDLANQARNADFINPNTNSATAGRLADLGLVEPADVHVPRVSGLHLVLGAINKIRAGATLTDGEREAIARIGTTMGTPKGMDAALVDGTEAVPSKLLEDMKAYIAGWTPGQDQNNRETSQ